LNNVIDRLSPFQEQPNQYDLTLRDVAASIQELQTQGPSVAGVPDAEMSNLLDALANVPGEAEKAPAPEPGI
jgi:hypothetical protein